MGQEFMADGFHGVLGETASEAGEGAVIGRGLTPGVNSGHEDISCRDLSLIELSFILRGG